MNKPAMNEPAIVNRGDGPRIAGTRISVLSVYEYMLQQRSRDWIAAALSLSSDQVAAAMAYIEDCPEEVETKYAQVRRRIAKGNSPAVAAQLQRSRKRLRCLRDELAGKHQAESRHAENHVG